MNEKEILDKVFAGRCTECAEPIGDQPAWVDPVDHTARHMVCPDSEPEPEPIPEPGSVRALMRGCACPVQVDGPILAALYQGVVHRVYELSDNCPIHQVTNPADA